MTKSRPYRVLEHGTTIYRPTTREPRWRVVTVDTTRRRSSRPVADEPTALKLARLWESYVATATPIPRRRAARIVVGAEREVPPADVETRLRDHVTAWLDLMAPTSTPNGWIGWSSNHHKNVASTFRNHAVDVVVRGNRKWGDLYPEAWTELDSRLLLRQAAATTGTQALRRIRAHLSAFQGYLHEARALPLGMMPATRIPLPRVLGAEAPDMDGPVDRDALPSMIDCEKLFAVADEAGHHDLGIALRLKHFAGPRFSELIALRPSDVNTDDLTLRVVRVWDSSLKAFLPTKNRKRRETFFPAAIVEDLAELVDRRRAIDGDGGLLFPNQVGNPIVYGTFHNQWLRLVKAAGWPMVDDGRYAPTPSGRRTFRGRCEWTPHDLRHVAACWMLFDLKLDPGEVSLALGHYSVEFTMRVYVDARGANADAVRTRMREWR